MTNTWLITGGSNGLGLALGRAVLQKGDKVILTSRNVAAAQAGSPDIEKNGGKWILLDFADSKADSIVKHIVETEGVNILVNNAGYATVGSLEDCSLEAIQAQYETNVFAPIRLAKAVIPFFRERKAGTIINIGSSVSFAAMPGASVYASSKAALKGISDGLALEVAPFGIRVLLFELGRFRTNFGAGANFAGPGEGFSDPYKETVVGKVVTFLHNPPPSTGDPDEAALRIYEVATKSGFLGGSNIENVTKLPLGPDAHAMMMKSANGMLELASMTEEIANSTDFKE
ncbi:hypothetical protein MMC25_001857 [Agyrium rufum]|nr:hypothetical protein [Agyrium rufum]